MKRAKKKVLVRLFFFAPLSIGLIVYFVVSFGTYIYRISSLNKEKEQLTSTLANLQEDELELKTEIEKLNDPDYIARYAREHYLYTKDGEYVIKMEESPSVLTTDSDVEYDYRYLIIPGALLLLIVLILFGKKMGKRKGK